MKATKLAEFSGLILLAVTCSHGQGTLDVIAPPDASGNENGNSSFAPFATTAAGRFQQVYSASIFSGILPAGGGLIRGFSFRVDAAGFNYVNQIASLQVHLSTTSRNPDSLSPVFADNVGVDDRIMLVATNYRVAGAVGAGFGANGFGGGFFSSAPFYYNPADGNLLLDFRIYTGAGNFPAGGVLDAFNIAGDSVSSVSAFGATLPNVGSASSLGLATAFFMTPVPEPSSWALLFVGVICFALWHWKRKEAPCR